MTKKTAYKKRRLGKKIKQQRRLPVLACGGTHKDDTIELQGNHKDDAIKALIKLGYNESNIDIA